MALMLLPTVALAEATNGEIVYADAGSTFTIENGRANILFKIKNNSGSDTITITGISANAGSAELGTIGQIPLPGANLNINPGVERQYAIVVPISGSSSGTFPLNIIVNYSSGSDTGTVEEFFLVTRQAPVATPEPETPADTTTALMLASVGADGKVIPAPKGDMGDKVQVRLPIFNRSYSRISNILVTPQLSANRDNFPFVIGAVDYTVSVADMRGGDVREVVYDFTLAKDVTSGVKEVKFNAVYFNNTRQAFETATFSVFVTVVKGATPEKTDEDGNLIATTPKIILEGYTITPQNAEDQQSGRLFAGEKFSIKLAILNTSGEEAVKNIQLTLSNEGGVILPADNGSNTVYIDKIGAGETVEKTLTFQSAPDAEAKAHSLVAKFNYESSKTLKAYDATETITLPISQRMRVRIDEPVVYGDAMLEQPMPVSFSLYNMGKSTLYNCMVDIEGDGLKMEESFYGGNITSGNTMRADFNVIPSTAGQIEGKVIITYEDVYGEQTRVEKALTLNVLENMMPEEGMKGPDGEVFNPGMEEQPPQGGLPIGLIIAIGAVVAFGVVVLLVSLKRKRRKKQLEDL